MVSTSKPLESPKCPLSPSIEEVIYKKNKHHENLKGIFTISFKQEICGNHQKYFTSNPDDLQNSTHLMRAHSS